MQQDQVTGSSNRIKQQDQVTGSCNRIMYQDQATGVARGRNVGSQERCRGRFPVGAEARNTAEAGSETLQELGTLQKTVLEERRPILEFCRSQERCRGRFLVAAEARNAAEA